MNTGQAIYQEVDRALKSSIAGEGGFNEYIQVAPVLLPAGVFEERQARLKTIQTFLTTTLNIFRGVVNGEFSPNLRRLLFNDVPESYGIEFHRKLPEEVWRIPQFFRTDESKSGKILEIQCPGSGWGDLELLWSAYKMHKLLAGPGMLNYKPSLSIADEIIKLSGKSNPTVLHLLDNSSSPTSMRYLLATSQPPLRYWGYEKSVQNRKCDFVRSHSFFGLVAENLFQIRVQDAANGIVKFDLPPILVFDQKIPLCLPFLAETKALFEDGIRDILAESYPVTETGCLELSGEQFSVDAFLKKPASKRRFFLKYAGCDVSLNWGARAVVRLDDGKAGSFLRTALEDAKRDHFWLMQPEISQKESIKFFNRGTGEEVQKIWTAKYSCFYGPTRLLGVRTMHRNHPKVHGQEDTAVGIAIPGSPTSLI
jgi:hypothetical protein